MRNTEYIHLRTTSTVLVMGCGNRDLRTPFGDINRLSSSGRWPNHLFCGAANIEGSEGLVNRFLTTVKRLSPYTGGYNRRVSNRSGTSVTPPAHNFLRNLTVYHRSQIFHVPNMFESGSLFGSQHTNNFFSQPVQDVGIIRKHCDNKRQSRRSLQWTVRFIQAPREGIPPTVSLPAIRILIISSLINLGSAVPSISHVDL